MINLNQLVVLFLIQVL